MRSNRLRELLDGDLCTIGTRLQSVAPTTVEIVGHTGLFDYVEFLAEYAPFDLHDLENFCRAAELHNMSTMIKVEPPWRSVAQRAIGSGFQSVLFADCCTSDDAGECVRVVRPDTPVDLGTYGAATRRMALMSFAGDPDYVQALRDIVIIMMIEKASAVDQLDRILTVDGIDMVQWGPTDYSMSNGQPGARNSPEVKRVERQVIDTCLQAGVPPRAEIGSVDDAKYYLDLGIRHFSLGTDISILFQWLRTSGENLRKAIESY
jgi:4-hydroxy-2-oxoheptanedioate aldolase